MNTEVYIKINKFGHINNATLKFFPLLIMTGNSSLGKSYVNYLFYFLMKSVSGTKMYLDIIKRKFKTNLNNEQEYKLSIPIATISNWLNSNVQTFINQFLGTENLICDVEFIFKTDSPTDINISFSIHSNSDHDAGDIQYEILYNIDGKQSTEKILFLTNDNFIESVASKISSIAKDLFFGHNYFRSILLPPSRGSLVGSSFTGKTNAAKRAGMYDIFLHDNDICSLELPFDYKTEDSQFYQERIKTLLNGELITKEDKQYLQISTQEEPIPLTATASSIKELSPLLFLLKNWSRFPSSICLEEPEAHLHPLMQIDIADLLAAIINKGFMIQMTTHSDYLLQRLNQLILLGDIRKKDQKSFESFRQDHKMNKRYFLNREDVGCYYFHLDNNQVKIDFLEPTEEGLPLKTFFDAVRKLSSFDEDIQSIIRCE